MQTNKPLHEINHYDDAAFPAFHNDDVGIRMVMNKGIPLREALDWNPCGCVEANLGEGSASVKGLVNDEDDYVQLIVDKEAADEEWFGCNPGINTAHLKIKTEDLLHKFLPKIYHKAKIVTL